MDVEEEAEEGWEAVEGSMGVLAFILASIAFWSLQKAIFPRRGDRSPPDS